MATSKVPLQHNIGNDSPTLRLGIWNGNARHTTGEYAKTNSSPRHPGFCSFDFIKDTTQLRVSTYGNYTDPWTISYSPESHPETFTTPTGVPRPFVDGANTSGNIMVLPEPSLSDEEEFDINDYVNKSDSDSDTPAALNRSARVTRPTDKAKSMQYGSLMTVENLASGHGSKQDDLPLWYNEEYEDLDPFANAKANSNALKHHCTDPTLSSLLDWELSDFEM